MIGNSTDNLLLDLGVDDARRLAVKGLIDYSTDKAKNLERDQLDALDKPQQKE